MTIKKELIKATKAYLEAGLEVIPNHPVKKYPFGVKGWEKRNFTPEEINVYLKKGWGNGVKKIDEGIKLEDGGVVV